MKFPREIEPLEHWSLFRSKLFWAYDRCLSASREWPYHSFPTAAWLLREGRLTLRFPAGEEHYEAGTWVFPAVQSRGVQHFSDNARVLALRFQAEWRVGMPILDRSRTVAVAEADAPELTADAEALVAFGLRTFGKTAEQAVNLKGTFEQFLDLQPFFTKWLASYYRLLTANGVRPIALGGLHEKVRLALHLMERQPLSEPLHERQLATKIGFSLSQLNKLFAKEIGMSIAALWNTKRLSAAKSELAHSSESIKSIAYNLGFSSPEHFSSWFKIQTELSPRTYRNLNRLGRAPLL